MMADRALQLVGVPFVHQGRSAKFGLDCIGLLVDCALAAGRALQDTPDYWAGDGRRLLRSVDSQFIEAERVWRRNAVVLTKRKSRATLPSHVVICIDDARVVHANDAMRFVSIGSVSEYIGLEHSFWRLP